MIRALVSVLIAGAIIIAQLFYGGILKAVFSVPTYWLIGIAGIVSLALLFTERNIPPRSTTIFLTISAASYFLWRSMVTQGQDLSLFYTLLITSCILVYTVFATFLVRPTARYYFICILLVAAIIQIIVACVQFKDAGYYWPIPWFSEQIRAWYFQPNAMYARGHGFYLNANHLAWFLNIMTFFSLSIACIGRCAIWAKLVFAYLSAVCVVGMVLTLSRGGIIGFISGMIVFILLIAVAIIIGAMGRRMVILLITFGGIASTICAAYLLFSTSTAVQARFSNLTKDTYRPALWPAALRQVQISPIIGTGAGSFSQLCRQLRSYESASDDTYAHNDWAQTMADFGLTGLACISCAFFVNLITGLLSYIKALKERMAISSRPQSNAAAFSLGAISSLTACAVHSIFDFNMQIPANALLAAACAGMLANSGVLTNPIRKSWTIYLFPSLTVLLSAGYLLFLVNRSAKTEWLALLSENALMLNDSSLAIDYAESGLSITSNHSRLRRLLGEALLQSAPFSNDPRAFYIRAAYFLRRASEGDPQERWSRLMLAIALASLKQTKAAEIAHIEAIRLDPGNPTVYEYYALFLEGDGRLAEAIRAYEVSLAMPGATFAHKRVKALRERMERAVK